MIIQSAIYVSSSTHVYSCPDTTLPEYAFIGRSNVGKSSLINMITGRKNLARISSKPGKTQAIQHYLINDEWYLVDLPGFGYARSSLKERIQWEKMIATYLLERTSLMNTFVLVDNRLPPQPIDIELVNWLGEHQLPFTILFTKTDKISLLKGEKNIDEFMDALKSTWEEFPPSIMTSALTRKGKTEILDLIADTNRIFSKK
ncbi:MAG: ribosome biogenesis GTP-binding protein YihA/YsxC [Bacteroidales bacterium]|nr:ribosome biogenesis GTP-binding protein YihA/YsxC [Bacteroidales bacterium]